ncbi:pyruvate synthase subunit PorB [Desulfovibrio aminophilus]|uniref:pyruvate synthase subunit PorB n=1 Tax=Desulfovibrio aminophilus TaxID=81425 RepID=UPI00339204A9
MLTDIAIDYAKITAKNTPKECMISSGHRACQGCGEILAMGMVTKAAGRDIIVANATGCMEIVTSPYPQTAWKLPWLHVAFENTAAVGSGIEATVKVLHRQGKIKKKPHVICFAGDGATADIGLQALSGALERGHDMLYVCLDNEAYMNTGIQRSSSTPWGATTTTSPAGRQSKGQHTQKKNLPLIAAAHGIPYVATASPAFHLDLMNKVRKALAVDGPAYLHVYAPCPTGWGLAGAKSVEIARLAVSTKVFPLYEVIGGRFVISRKPAKPQPVLDYLKPQRRFRHLGEHDVAAIQQSVDAAWDYLERLAKATRKDEE